MASAASKVQTPEQPSNPKTYSARFHCIAIAISAIAFVGTTIAAYSKVGAILVVTNPEIIALCPAAAPLIIPAITAILLYALCLVCKRVCGSNVTQPTPSTDLPLQKKPAPARPSGSPAKPEEASAAKTPSPERAPTPADPSAPSSSTPAKPEETPTVEPKGPKPVPVPADLYATSRAPTSPEANTTAKTPEPVHAPANPSAPSSETPATETPPTVREPEPVPATASLSTPSGTSAKPEEAPAAKTQPTARTPDPVPTPADLSTPSKAPARPETTSEAEISHHPTCPASAEGGGSAADPLTKSWCEVDIGELPTDEELKASSPHTRSPTGMLADAARAVCGAVRDVAYVAYHYFEEEEHPLKQQKYSHFLTQLKASFESKFPSIADCIKHIGGF